MLKKNKELRTMTIIALILSVVGIAFACVAMNIALDAKQNERALSVRFGDLEIEKKGTVTSEQPIIELTSLSNVKATLKNKDDSVTYRFKVINEGVKDARLKVLSKIKPKCVVLDQNASSDGCEKVEYFLTYNNGIEVKSGDVLKSGFNKELILNVKYSGNVSTLIEVSDLDFIFLFEQV